MVQICELLTDSLAQALETMAFWDVMSPDEDSTIPEKTILGQISFTGSKAGTIEMLAGMEFTRTLAENFAALDDADEESCLDALKELCNVVCGLLLPMLASSDTDVFDIAVPTIDNSDNLSGWNEFIQGANCRVLNIEGHLVAVRVVVKS
jgi:CheY-specific phosphatase CheX